MNQEVALLDQPAEMTLPSADFCIHELFERTAAHQPHAAALTCDGQTLTYSQLNRRANQLAHLLKEAGAAPEIPVLCYLERSIDMVVAILAVLKSGSAYVPVDMAYPNDRLRFMRDDSRACIVITQSHLRDRAAFENATVICVDSDAKTISAQLEANLATGVRPDNAAYIIYTSGSTGKPKGVLVTHHNVARLLKETEHWFGFNASDVWPLFHSYAFDVSVFEVWGCFFYGGRLVVVPYLVSRSPLEFYELLAREKVTVLNQTPSAFRQLIWAEESAPTKHELALRYVVCAGEALELQSLKPWFSRHGDERPKIVNMYGITEITVHATFRIIREADLASGVGSVIGVPIPDLQVYLVDEALRPVPRGKPGEICVGGAGVARGYLNRPELNAARFIPDPFSARPGAAMYRSGDLARYNEHGELEYLGRLDHQVKIRGFRVELGEIESALNRHPGIRETVVIALDAPGGGKRLAAYFVSGSAPPTVTDLRAWLGRSLPDYMIPAFFVPLRALPLTTNGKVDRRALPAPEAGRPSLKTEYLAPRNATEALLAEIWSRVLEIHPVGVRDNLFELGGDSIRSIAILSWAQQKGLRLTLQEVFQNPTVATLAACADTKAGMPHEENPPTVPFALVQSEDRNSMPAGVMDAYPLARLQLGMFYHNELNPASAIYHDVFSFRITAPFREEKLKASVDRLVQRHPALRTSFHLAGFSQPLQVVHDSTEVQFTVEDVTSLAAPAQEESIPAWIEAEKRRPFDRARAPLIRFHVQIQRENAFQFFVSFHHSCLDGWSLAAVMTEIFQDYAALLQGREEPIPSPRVTYRDFVALEQQAVASEQAASFWSALVAGAELQLLPRWPKAHCERGEEQKRGPELEVPAEALSALKQLAQKAGVPLKTVLLSAHLKVMSFYSGRKDVVTSLVSNGRPECMDGEKLVGLFLNTLPFRLKLEGGTWLQLARQTFALEQAILPHRRFPLAEIHKLNGGHPLFETAFDFVHFHVYKSLQGYRDFDFAEGHYFEANNLTIYTTFMLDTNSAQLQLHLDYDPNVICRKQIEEISHCYLRVLESMAGNASARHESLNLLTPAERHLLLNEWNLTGAPYPKDRCVHELVLENARAHPEAIAVTFGERDITYRELSAAVGRVSAALRQAGARTGTLVGVLMERRPEMLMALLGVWQCGAAYVPLDPGFPAARLEFMLADSGAAILLTESKLRPILPKTPAQIVEMETVLSDRLFETPITEAPAGAATLAYVIYTSGSTGTPKGVEVVHRGVVNLLLSAARTANVTAKDVLLAVTTLSFDIAGLELFMPLVLGGRVHLASREIAGDGTRLARLLESSGATLMQATPATWRLLIESGWKGNSRLKVFCGGEALKRSLADQLLRLVPEVWNFYGPTETTIWSTAWNVTPGDRILIGRPLANTQLYILDEYLLPTPPGVVGELCIAGDGLARGYHDRPELTAEKFPSNPYGRDVGERVYRTGDLARYMPDGNVDCLGRIDHQVKIRGFRIELGEIEAVLKDCPGVADAIVTAQADHSGEPRLVAYLVCKNGPLPLAEVRDLLKHRLPHYMVPALWVCLPLIPLTPNGKIDLRSLPAPESQSHGQRALVEPRNSEERIIAEVWRDVLSLKTIGITDDFFELGADSLSATRAFARLNEALNLDLTLREILENPSVEALAAAVKERKKPQRRLPPLLARRLAT